MDINLITIFISGILLSLTPCVLPVLPILHRTISDQKNIMFSSLVYVIGMSLSYATIGLIIAFLGQELNIQAYIQSKTFNIAIGVIFAFLSLSMFGLLNINIPLISHIQRFSDKIKTDSYKGVFGVGFFSALILSPCITAPLAGILIFIAKEGNLVKTFY